MGTDFFKKLPGCIMTRSQKAVNDFRPKKLNIPKSGQ